GREWNPGGFHRDISDAVAAARISGAGTEMRKLSASYPYPREKPVGVLPALYRATGSPTNQNRSPGFLAKDFDSVAVSVVICAVLSALRPPRTASTRRAVTTSHSSRPVAVS